ncbi:glycosyltransferase family 2 protein [Oleiharenicola lentus]|uniref:glycosyltransferase family 2 protein n=1 Tax=Oleiharenicola lentus TaxID=2508720 RepID=UPI003F67239D
MTVSFIIPLYNCLPLTQVMLGSLRATLPAGLDHEVIFVDDGSTDGTREWLRTLAAPCRFFLNEQNLGFAGSCNRGAASAVGEFIFFLNNDLVLKRGWLEPMLQAFELIPSPGLIGNIQRNAATHSIDHAGLYFTHQGKPAHRTDHALLARWLGRPRLRKVPALTGACFAVRRTIWQKLGGFDEGFRNGGEDVDLCLRAANAGLVNAIALNSVVLHHISQSSGRKLRDEENSARLAVRWKSEIIQLATKAWAFNFMAQHADRSHVMDYRLLHAALLHWAFLPAPRGVIDETTVAFDLEIQRWRELLDHASPPPAKPAEPILVI